MHPQVWVVFVAARYSLHTMKASLRASFLDGAVLTFELPEPVFEENLRSALYEAVGCDPAVVDFVVMQGEQVLSHGDAVDVGLAVSVVKRPFTDCLQPSLKPCASEPRCVMHCRFDAFRRTCIANGKRQRRSRANSESAPKMPRMD